MGGHSIIKNDLDVELQTSQAEIPFLFPHHVRCQSIQSPLVFSLSTPIYPILTTLTNAPDYNINK